MKCQKCGGKKDVVDFYVREDKLILCVDCRAKMFGKKSKAR